MIGKEIVNLIRQLRLSGMEYLMKPRPISESSCLGRKLEGKTAVATFGRKTSQAPMMRAGQPCEVSPCYVFLASDDASYMTVQVLHPNGGTIVGS